jgi:hypothetical protein
MDAYRAVIEMRVTSIHISGSILQLTVFAVFVYCYFSANLPVVGCVLLIVASAVDLFALALSKQLGAKQSNQTQMPGDWRLQQRAYVYVLTAWQAAIIGFVNLWSPLSFGSTGGSLVTGYVLVGSFTVLSYKSIALADSLNQEGGSKPISYFGRPRSRRLLFAVLIYSILGPLVLVSLVWADWERCPIPFRPPQIWVLLISLLSVFTAGLVFHRYHGAGTNRQFARGLLAAAVLTVGCIMVVGNSARYSPYMYLLSSLALVCVTATVYWLSLAKEALPVGVKATL